MAVVAAVVYALGAGLLCGVSLFRMAGIIVSVGGDKDSSKHLVTAHEEMRDEALNFLGGLLWPVAVFLHGVQALIIFGRGVRRLLKA
jgi:hypothetical protein